MAGLTGLSAAVRRLRRRRVARLWAIAAALVALAVVLVPLAVANIGETIEGSTPPPGPPAASTPARTARPKRPLHASPAPRLAQATLTIGPALSTAPVPTSFFGISTEYWTLPLFERDSPVFERVLSLLHVAGDGPLILRIGGDSADHAFWSARDRK